MDRNYIDNHAVIVHHVRCGVLTSGHTDRTCNKAQLLENISAPVSLYTSIVWNRSGNRLGTMAPASLVQITLDTFKRMSRMTETTF